MKKIPNIFVLEIAPDGTLACVTDEQNDICKWVFDGEGIATRKYDGTCCCVYENPLNCVVAMRRRTVKPAKKGKPAKKEPNGFILADHDINTGKSFGWVPVTKDDKYHYEAFEKLFSSSNVPKKELIGTYELCGPNIQGNPECYSESRLIRHSMAKVYPDVPRNYFGLKGWLGDHDIEGLVFIHPDGRMAKIRKKDFGLKRKYNLI